MIHFNHNLIAVRLKKRGWEDEHIRSTIHILKKAQIKKQLHIKFLDKNLYWFIILFLILGNIIILTGLIYLVVFLPMWLTIFFVMMIGLIFGFIVDNLLLDIEMTHKHYVVAGSVVALMSTATLLIVISLVESTLTRSGIFIKSNPLILILFYLISLILPHIITRLKWN